MSTPICRRGACNEMLYLRIRWLIAAALRCHEMIDRVSLLSARPVGGILFAPNNEFEKLGSGK
jgi:hypothetical protein